MKRTNTLFGIHADFLNATTGSNYRPSYHWLQKIKMYITLFELAYFLLLRKRKSPMTSQNKAPKKKKKSKRLEKKENWENGETSSLYFSHNASTGGYISPLGKCEIHAKF